MECVTRGDAHRKRKGRVRLESVGTHDNDSKRKQHGVEQLWEPSEFGLCRAVHGVTTRHLFDFASIETQGVRVGPAPDPVPDETSSPGHQGDSTSRRHDARLAIDIGADVQPYIPIRSDASCDRLSGHSRLDARKIQGHIIPRGVRPVSGLRVLVEAFSGLDAELARVDISV
jgi:hypothetical protein